MVEFFDYTGPSFLPPENEARQKKVAACGASGAIAPLAVAEPFFCPDQRFTTKFYHTFIYQEGFEVDLNKLISNNSGIFGVLNLLSWRNFWINNNNCFLMDTYSPLPSYFRWWVAFGLTFQSYSWAFSNHKFALLNFHCKNLDFCIRTKDSANRWLW